MDLPEGGKLKKLVVPPASPLRPLGSGAQPDSSAALHEALAHGDAVLPLAPILITCMLEAQSTVSLARCIPIFSFCVPCDLQ